MSHDRADDATPTDPRRHRQVRLVRFLRVAVVMLAMVSAADLAAPDELQGVLGEALVAILIAAPLVRVAWLVQRWVRRGDLRFATVGAALLCVAALGAALG